MGNGALTPTSGTIGTSGREALIPPGRTQATSDYEEAGVLLAERLKELDAKRRGLVFHGGAMNWVTLGAYAQDHLVKKAKTGRFNPRWLKLCRAPPHPGMRVLRV